MQQSAIRVEENWCWNESELGNFQKRRRRLWRIHLIDLPNYRLYDKIHEKEGGTTILLFFKGVQSCKGMEIIG